MKLTIKRRSVSDVCDQFTKEEVSYGKYLAFCEWIITDADEENQSLANLRMI